MKLKEKKVLHMWDVGGAEGGVNPDARNAQVQGETLKNPEREVTSRLKGPCVENRKEENLSALRIT